MSNRLVELFKPVVGSEAIVAFQNPMELADRTAPQPDVAVLKLRDDYYARSHPVPSDALLLIEIADSSLMSDRRVKAPLYAQAGIPELWIINLADNSVEVHREPSDAGYLLNSIARGDETLSPAMLPSLTIRVGAIFG